MANCKLCKNDASLGHCICLHCLADWSKMRIVIADHLKEIDKKNNFKGADILESFKKLQTKWKKAPDFVRSLVEWPEQWPTWESNRCYRVLVRKEGEHSNATSKAITETLAYLLELYHNDRKLYNEQIQEIELFYGEK